jgi:hypothetical protein
MNWLFYGYNSTIGAVAVCGDRAKSGLPRTFAHPRYLKRHGVGEREGELGADFSSIVLPFHASPQCPFTCERHVTHELEKLISRRHKPRLAQNLKALGTVQLLGRSWAKDIDRLFLETLRNENLFSLKKV